MKGRPRIEIDAAKAQRLLDEGNSLGFIARTLGVSRGTVRRHLDMPAGCCYPRQKIDRTSSVALALALLDRLRRGKNTLALSHAESLLCALGVDFPQ
jgi:AraC-like DNA-binding protein